MNIRWRRPKGAHGRRSSDGSYFAVWSCQYGHLAVGEHDDPGRERCLECRGPQGPALWSRASPQEACNFLFELKGSGMYNSACFTITPEVAACTPAEHSP